MKKILLTFLFGLSLSLIARAQVPTVTNVSPLNAPVGATLTLTGTNFDTTPANNLVFFGGVATFAATATATSITVNVPTGATYCRLGVLNTQSSLMASSNQYFNLTFTPNKGNIALNDIAPKQDFIAGTAPRSAAIGDLDGDGKPDMAVANSSTVSIFRNTGVSGSPNFAAKQDFATGAIPRSVAIGDLDGDGKPDMAVANYGSATVSVFRNIGSSGSPNFAAKQDFTTEANPISVAIVDLDGDGKLDLATANDNGFSNVTVLRNIGSSGSLNFAAKQDFATGVGPSFIVAGDLDGDGKLDLATVNMSSSTISVLRNTGSSGSPNFAAKQDFATGSNPISATIGDLDGDGKADLAVTNFGSNNVSILRNNGSAGSPSFAAKQDFVTGTAPQSVAIGDIDGDGKADLVVTNVGSGTVSILHNIGSSGSPSFAAKQDFVTGSSPQSVAIADLDEDGKIDIVVANTSSNTVSVLRNNPQITPLPVSFGKFNASLQSNSIKLDWNTLSEINNKSFIVYRSANGINYTEIAQQTSKGNSANSYTLYDNSPLNGINYYRLKQKDYDGTVTALGDDAVNFSLTSEEVKVWPNPVDKWIKMSFAAGKYQNLKLMDISGKRLQERDIAITQSEVELDMSTYAKGTYIVELVGSKGNQTLKVLK